MFTIINKKNTSSHVPFTSSLKIAYDSCVKILSTISGTNTGDETTTSIQTKRPLKTINGNSLEGTGDISISGGGGGGTTLSFLEIEVDFGTTPVSSKKFNIIDPLVSATNTIIVTPSTNAATDRFGNDWEFDMPFFSAKSNNGNLDIYATFNHYVVGKRKIKYTKI